MKRKLQLALVAMMAACVVTQGVADDLKLNCKYHKGYARGVDSKGVNNLVFNISLPNGKIYNLKTNEEEDNSGKRFDDDDESVITNFNTGSMYFGVANTHPELSWSSATYGLIPETYIGIRSNEKAIGTLIDLISTNDSGSTFSPIIFNLPSFTSENVVYGYLKYKLGGSIVSDSDGPVTVNKQESGEIVKENLALYMTLASSSNAEYPKVLSGHFDSYFSLNLYTAVDSNGDDIEINSSSGEPTGTPAQMQLVAVCSKRYLHAS